MFAASKPSSPPSPPKFSLGTKNIIYEYDRYVATDIQTIRQKLDEYGVVIVPNVLNESQIKNMNNCMFQTIEHMSADFTGTRDDKNSTPITPIKRNDPSTWYNMAEFMPMHRMLIQYMQIGQAQYAWDVRGNPNLRSIFAGIMQTKEDNLLTSMDGVAIYLPTQAELDGSRTEKYPERLWMHTDERFDYSKDPYRYSVQSWVTGYDVKDGYATLAILEGSHKHHTEFGTMLPDTKDRREDWYKMNAQWEYDFFMKQKNCPLRAIKCNAGDAVFWNSRTMHCGIAGAKSQEVPRNKVYVAMQKKSIVPMKTILKRRKIFDDLRMTTHRPDKAKMFGKMPQTYGKKLQNFRAPPVYTRKTLPDHMRSLVPL